MESLKCNIIQVKDSNKLKISLHKLSLLEHVYLFEQLILYMKLNKKACRLNNEGIEKLLRDNKHTYDDNL